MHLRKTSFYFAIFCLMLGLTAQAQNDSQNASAAAMTSAERSAAAELFQAANQDRASQGLSPLRHDSALTQAAWDHAQRMVQSGELSHQLPGEPGLIARVQQAGVHCSTVAENIASGPSASKINDEWMHSASHRANLLDPRVNAVGIAVVKQHGSLFAVQDFAREMTALTPQQQERQVASLLSSQGLQIESDDGKARAYCNSEPRQTKPLPKLVMRYSTTDLSRLPQQVDQGIRSGSYHRAILGACAAANQNGFTAYQMVILLY
jgi:uncharacterized protein YkwD